MKKIATLLLAAGMVFGIATGASAVDFKAKGQWVMSFDYGKNYGFTGGNGRTGYGNGEDEFEARQRIRLQLQAVASEALSGTVFFEIGNTIWGQDLGPANRSTGGALGADGVTVEVKHAYLDWMVPQTDLKIRMGLQNVNLPSFTTGSQVFNDDVAAVVASYQFNENVGLTAFWARPYNDNGAHYSHEHYLDNIDMFGLVLPLTFDGVKISPWAMYAILGPGALGQNPFNPGASAGGGPGYNYFRAGMFPAGGARDKWGDAPANYGLDKYGQAWWAGLSGDITALDPFRIAFDLNYGSVTYDDSHLNRRGWLASLLFEYKLDWAVPGLYFWYSSGDDGNAGNGSERMPVMDVGGNDHGYSNFAFNGHPWIGREEVLGSSMVGTWGIGARLKDLSFVENLKHTFRVNYIGGTNSPKMARYLNGYGYPDRPYYDRAFSRALGNTFPYTGPNARGVGMENLYMTTHDQALELGLSTRYEMYENFTIFLDANYIATWINKGAWKYSVMNGRSDQVRDPWNINLSFVYNF